MSDHRSFPDAADGRPSLPMEPELWAAGCDLETARFVARQLAQQGYTIVRADLYEAERAENERLREIFQSMDDTIVARSELFISDQECLFNLRDRIRRALETKKAPGDEAEGLGST